MKPQPSAPYWPLLLFWTVLIAAGDLIFATTAWREHRALGFPTATAKIAQSRMGQGALGQRGLMLRYTYLVDGEHYVGHRYRYDVENVSLRYASVVNKYQPLSLHTVFYNPRDPADSVLSPGVDGSDWLLMLAAAPFNIVTVAMWLNLLARRRKARSENGGFKVIQQGNETRVRLAETPALAFGAYALAAGSAAAASLIIVLCGVDATPFFIAAAALAAGGLGLAAGLWKHVRNNSGRFDFAIGGLTGPVTLPATAGRREAVSVLRSDLTGVSVRRRSSKIPSGMYYSYVPALAVTSPGGPPRTVPLVTWGLDEDRALIFGRWLSAKLNARFMGVEDEVAAGASG